MSLVLRYPEIPKYMSITDTSAYFGVSKYFLRKGIRNGTIAHAFVGNRYMIDTAAFKRQMDSQVDFTTKQSKG
ncbi:MAG: helix-turn-helix domain-containing protein [Lachnospiraceae bacterium]|nr:helix-turn-helix domain-containing protein [Lachnospiraceae bacterium]